MVWIDGLTDRQKIAEKYNCHSVVTHCHSFVFAEFPGGYKFNNNRTHKAEGNPRMVSALSLRLIPQFNNVTMQSFNNSQIQIKDVNSLILSPFASLALFQQCNHFSDKKKAKTFLFLVLASSALLKERETGIEPATLSLGSWCSTPELFSLVAYKALIMIDVKCNNFWTDWQIKNPFLKGLAHLLFFKILIIFGISI